MASHNPSDGCLWPALTSLQCRWPAEVPCSGPPAPATAAARPIRLATPSTQHSRVATPATPDWQASHTAPRRICGQPHTPRGLIGWSTPVLQTIVKADRATARRDADLFYFRGRSTAGANPVLAWCSGRNSQRHNCNDAGRKLIDEAHWLGREIDQIAQDYASSLPVYLQHW